ncbi:hypothetical protein [Thalassospira marina]|uniref:Uncharacterized protein n=1 Tax=Thalassospira marina TaxID=2048283 RepID=A0A2N3KGZ8_9PROT|nr:hypothetical protein [Thalassospira marina]PKR49723.1 hypothetical protein COO20_22110 [Thalassospira marina]
MRRGKRIAGIAFVAAILFGGHELWAQYSQPKPVNISYSEPAAYRGWPVMYQLQANGEKLFSPGTATYGADDLPPDGGGIIGGIILPGIKNAPDGNIDWNISWIEWHTGHAYQAKFRISAHDFPAVEAATNGDAQADQGNGTVASQGTNDSADNFHHFIRIGKNGDLMVLAFAKKLPNGGLSRALGKDDFVVLYQGCAPRTPALEEPGSVLAEAFADKLGLVYGSGPKQGELIERIAKHVNDPVPDGSCSASSSLKGS